MEADWRLRRRKIKDNQRHLVAFKEALEISRDGNGSDERYPFIWSTGMQQNYDGQGYRYLVKAKLYRDKGT